MRILVIEDDQETASFIKSGFSLSVLAAHVIPAVLGFC
jgi:DNA-binding response OmpR family regulator